MQSIIESPSFTQGLHHLNAVNGIRLGLQHLKRGPEFWYQGGYVRLHGQVYSAYMSEAFKRPDECSTCGWGAARLGSVMSCGLNDDTVEVLLNDALNVVRPGRYPIAWPAFNDDSGTTYEEMLEVYEKCYLLLLEPFGLPADWNPNHPEENPDA